jgi:hypothetical protein
MGKKSFCHENYYPRRSTSFPFKRSGVGVRKHKLSLGIHQATPSMSHQNVLIYLRASAELTVPKNFAKCRPRRRPPSSPIQDDGNGSRSRYIKDRDTGEFGPSAPAEAFANLTTVCVMEINLSQRLSILGAQLPSLSGIRYTLAQSSLAYPPLKTRAITSPPPSPTSSPPRPQSSQTTSAEYARQSPSPRHSHPAPYTSNRCCR